MSSSSWRESGEGYWTPIAEIEELTMTRDGSKAYRYKAEDQMENAGDSWEYANAEVPDMEWSAEPDDDEPDDCVSVGLGLFGDVLLRARTCCPECPGACGRVS